MALDPSIYNQLKPIEMPSMLDSMGKAANLSALAMQQGRAAKQMQREDQEFAHADRIRKASEYGQALDSLSGMNPQQRAAAYPKLREQLIQTGAIKPEDAPPEHDEGFYRQTLSRYYQTKDFLDRATQKAQIKHLGAQDSHLAAQNAELRSKAEREAREQGMKLGSDLRKERAGLPTTKATQEISTAYNKIQGAAKIPSAAGDMSMIFGFMKLLDPGSTVREGEQASAQQATGVPSQILGLYNRALSGERLTPAQRADFLNQAQNLYQAQMAQQTKIDKDFERLAVKHGANPDDVLMNFGANMPEEVAQQRLAGQGVPGVPAAQAAPPAIKPGEVRRGFVFNGGDPSNKANWKKASK